MPLIGLTTALRELAKVPSRVTAKAAPAIEQMWRRSYLAGTDPYGNAWAPNRPSTIKKKGHDLVMFDTHETFNMTRVRPLPGAGLSLRTGPKAAWHMEPTENRPARRVLPAFGLPKAWRAKLRAIAAAEFQRAARG